MLRYLQISIFIFLAINIYCQPLLKLPVFSDDPLLGVCKASPEFETQVAHVACGQSFTPTKLFSNNYKEILWNFGNGSTYSGFNCPPQTFNKQGIVSNMVTLKNDVEFTVLKSIKINFTNNSWSDLFDTEPDFYIDFILDNTRVFQSCYKSDIKTPLTFILPQGFILEKDIKIEIYDFDPIDANDFIASFLIPKNSASQKLSNIDTEIEIVTEKTKTTTFDFKINVPNPATISEQKTSCETATLTANGGNNYLWNNGATSKTINVGIGTYSVTVSSNGACSGVSSIEVKKPNFEKPIVYCSPASLLCVNYTSNLQWYNEDSTKVFGAILANFKPVKSGKYFVRYKGGGPDVCPTVSDLIDWPQCSMPSSSNIELTKEVNLYPNPTSSNLFLKGLSGQSYSLEIINNTGMTVKMMDRVDDNAIINIDDLPDGMYFVKLSDKGELLKMKKIIKMQ